MGAAKIRREKPSLDRISGVPQRYTDIMVSPL